jgi:hypothetical protein
MEYHYISIHSELSLSQMQKHSWHGTLHGNRTGKGSSFLLRSHPNHNAAY